ncbi:hypothetical protein BC941DRAFT_411082 [Chlamydoabsidia padenii]|nr:hypothetical protein BC941DRAFT_411082 [Chlamydoabsidia padenii]
MLRSKPPTISFMLSHLTNEKHKNKGYCKRYPIRFYITFYFMGVVRCLFIHGCLFRDALSKMTSALIMTSSTFVPIRTSLLLLLLVPVDALMELIVGHCCQVGSKYILLDVNSCP